MSSTTAQIALVGTSKRAVVPARQGAPWTAGAAAVHLWAVATFGAVYPWAYWPLVAAVSVIGAAMWLRAGGWRGGLWWVAALVVAPVAIQATPIGNGLLAHVASGNARALSVLDVSSVVPGRMWHALSVAPSLTLTSLVFLAAGALWVAGLSAGLKNSVRAAAIARALLWLGLGVAIVALAQKATFNGRIYWFWESQFKVADNYFGPFVNRNHYAGWMTLALALGTGHFLGHFARAGECIRPGWRERVLWLGSAEASRILMVAAALGVMAVSLVWSLSRSGIAGAAVSMVMLAVASIFRLKRGAGRRLAVAYVVLALVAAASWKGLDTLSTWYGDTRTLEWRIALWKDSLAPLRDFLPLGAGLNTYGAVMLLYPEPDPAVHAQQAHNDYLQLAIEGGILVALPWIVAAIAMARRIVRRLRQDQDEMTWWIRMGAVAGVCGVAVQEISEFSLQIPGVALLFATLVAIGLHEPAHVQGREGRHQRSGPRVPFISIAHPPLRGTPGAI